MEGKAVARVGKVSGKTLEINFFNINDKYYFVDLPGYGYAQKGLDQREMIRSMIIGYLTNKNFQPRTVAVVLDSKAGLTDFDREVLDILSDNNHHAKIIVTKTDKVTQKELSQLVSSMHKECEGIEILQYSSVNERGKEKLLEKLIG